MIIKKQYSIRKLNWKFDYKNQKYTVTEVILLYTICLNIKNVHSMFHVNWLCLAADDSLPSQPQSDDQPAPIYIKSEKEWYINKIIAEKLCCHNCDVIKWFQIKYTSYIVSKWNQAMNMKDTATLKWWIKYMREFWNAHDRLLNGFWYESHPRWTLWCHAVKQRGIVTG